ncbi:MAG: hypothetical protein DRN26_05690 [Thermoplasmata archaeon]|nr:MAG: hypothetical protein DRN26_05690 [Thermoplasmata archaeon]
MPGTPEYIAKVKAGLKTQLGADNIGEDTNHDGMYAGKSLALGEGGRSKLLLDKITLQFVEKGMSLKQALLKAKQAVWSNGVKKYGKKAMQYWATHG